ncbi:type III-A CRISPR-associated RAMP protein Csm4 [Patescibacteria group bacterium]|nr:type III-A CRISPR-associated RAMP protein Csm4 [Patescibacteria group bacterium]
MNWYIVRLKFLSPLHIGDDEAGIGVENVQSSIHSDTIFSAFVNAASLIDERSVDFLLQGNFRISSAFPYNKERYYLPRPFYPFPSSFGKHSKKVKRSQFLREADFQAWIRGEVNQENIVGPISRSQHAEEISDLDVRPRNASDRQTSNTVIYHCGGSVFQENCGLYFVLETDSGGKGRFQEILETLKKFGLGGERSTGYGQFDFEIIGPVDREEGTWRNIKTNAGGDSFCLLSLWHPTESEEIGAKAYQTVLRKGWIFSTSSAKQMKRKTFRMFKEGSVFRNQPIGELVDVTPQGFDDHKVYRWGKALSVKMAVIA